jgi:hypothetical protein
MNYEANKKASDRNEIDARSTAMIENQDATHQEDDDHEQEKKTPATAPGVFSDEPNDEYELETGVPIDATDGRTESDQGGVSIPETGAGIEDAVEPDTDIDLDLGIEADAKDGTTEDESQDVVVPETGTSVSIEEDEA